MSTVKIPLLLSHVNDAYASAAYDCNGPAMLALGELHRTLVKIQEGQGVISDSDIMERCLEILSSYSPDSQF